MARKQNKQPGNFEHEWTDEDEYAAQIRGWRILNRAYCEDRQFLHMRPLKSTNLVEHDMDIAEQIVHAAIAGDELCRKACRAISMNAEEVAAVTNRVGKLTWLLALQSPSSATAQPDQPASARPISPAPAGSSSGSSTG